MEGCRESKLLVTRKQDIDDGSAMFIGELAIVGEKGGRNMAVAQQISHIESQTDNGPLGCPKRRVDSPCLECVGRTDKVRHFHGESAAECVFGADVKRDSERRDLKPVDGEFVEYKQNKLPGFSEIKG